MVLGVLIVLAPVSGLPLTLRAVLEFALGVAVFLVGLSWRMRDMRRAHNAFESSSVIEPEPPVRALPMDIAEAPASSESSSPPQMGAF